MQPLGPPWTAGSPYFLNDGRGVFSRLPDNLGLGQYDTYALAELGGGRGLDVVSGGDPDIELKRTVRPSGRRLYGAVGPERQISLVLESGRPARLVSPGSHRIVVWDRSPTTGFRLRGPGVNDYTTAAYTGVSYWTVYLKRRSRYVFSSTTNPSRRGAFKTAKGPTAIRPGVFDAAADEAVVGRIRSRFPKETLLDAGRID